MALGPKTDNQVGGGDGNVLTGHNSGTITVGLTFQEHQKALEKALAEKQADLERAHGAEKALLQNQLDAITEKLADVETDYKKRLDELSHTKKLLSRHEKQIAAEKRDAAYAALDQGETRLAEALLKELAKKARARREDAAIEEAELEFELGKLAEAEIRWLESYEHYKRAAQLIPNAKYLRSQSWMAYQLFKVEDAIRVQRVLVNNAAKVHGYQSRVTAVEIHNLASIFEALENYNEAEFLYRESLEVFKHANGEMNSEYAVALISLSKVFAQQGRYSRAVRLTKKALEILRLTIGTYNLWYPQGLTVLASVFLQQGYYKDAEDLLRESLEISKETIDIKHPEYGIQINNLARLLWILGRNSEAEKSLEEALTIFERIFPYNHPYVTATREALLKITSTSD